MKKIKNFYLFKESLNKTYEKLLQNNSLKADFLVYIANDEGHGSELEKVYEFLIENDFHFPGSSHDNTIIYNDDLYNIKYVLVDVKIKEITYHTGYNGPKDKESLYGFLLGMNQFTLDANVYIFDNFLDLNRYLNPVNINNYFDKKLIYESLLDKLEGPSKQDAINGLNDKFANGELKSEEYFEKLIENGFLREIDDFLYGYDYDYETLYYGLSIAIDYKKYDVIEYLLDLGINKSDIEIELKEKSIDEKVKTILQKYINKNG